MTASPHTAPTAPAPSPSTRTIDASRLYFAVLEAPGAWRAGPLPEGLAPLLEDCLPAPLQGLHAVVRPLGAGRVLAVAGDAAELAAAGAGAARLVPSAVPEGIASGEVVDPGSIDLLVGDLEPAPIRAARARRRAALSLAACACCLLAAAGLLRRAGADAERARRDSAAASALLAAHAPPTRPNEAGLASAVASARSALASARGAAPAPDAAATLAAVLAAWPGPAPGSPPSPPLRPASISVQPDGVSFALLVEGDAAAAAALLRAPPGLLLDEPQISLVPGQAADRPPLSRIAVRMRPAPAGGAR